MSWWVGYLFAEALVSKPWLTRHYEGRETAHNEDQAPAEELRQNRPEPLRPRAKTGHLITLFHLIPWITPVAGHSSCAICSDYAEFPHKSDSGGPIKDSSAGLCPHDGWFFGNSLEIMIECESIDRSNAQNRQSPSYETSGVVRQGLDSKS